MKTLIKTLNKESNARGVNISTLFENMLDFFLETFEPSRFIAHKGDMSAVFAEREKDDAVLFNLLRHWIETAEEEIARKGICDFFGELYESLFLGKSKASAMGQFFTPMVLSQVMAECTGGEDPDVLEPSCVSGRNVLAHWEQADKTRPPYYKCVDLDPISVKMCTLNMMINGMIGEVTCKDSLDLSDRFHFAYRVNEVRWPFPSPFYSIRLITPHRKQTNK